MSFIKAAIRSTIRLLSFSRTASQVIPSVEAEYESQGASHKRTASVAFTRSRRSSSVSSHKRICIPISALRSLDRDRSTSVDRAASTDTRSDSEFIDPKIESYSSSSSNNVEAHIERSDRHLMPPPSKAKLVRRASTSLSEQHDASFVSDDAASQRSKSVRGVRADTVDEYDMEEARRRAVATQLPPGSGVWEPDEQQLFFHLAYRGFEPLLDHSWMIDFPTLPVSIFAHQGSDAPMIECQQSTPFRATKALEELLTAGTRVRDHNIAHQNLASEPILERAISRYIAWALKDAKLKSGYSANADNIPVHAISAMQRGETTAEVLYRLALKMHVLANRHKKRHREASLAQLASDDTDQSPGDELAGLPVIYGVAICRSILMMFTLSCHAAVPPFATSYIAFQSTKKNSETDFSFTGTSYSTTPMPNEADDDLGVRYIAAFDFSEDTRDVWNSLAIAILTMQIRKTLSEQEKGLNHENQDAKEESLLSNFDAVAEHDESQTFELSSDPDA